jgi:hypothetical protein
LEAWKAQEHELHLQEVWIQILRFLKLTCGLGRSCNIEYTATRIMNFRWVSNEISWFEHLNVKLNLIDPWSMIRIRLIAC